MSDNAIGLIVLACIFGASLLGMLMRPALSQHHLSADTKDSVKLGMGLVGTMAALILGLLVAAAKSAYDTEKNEVTQMAAKLVFLDRVLANYGPSRRIPVPCSAAWSKIRSIACGRTKGPTMRNWSQSDPVLRKCTKSSRSWRRVTMCRSRSSPRPSESPATLARCAGCCLSSQAVRSPCLC